VVTNIDNDHLDYYGNLDKIKTTFLDFINKVPFYGCAILGIDDANLCQLLSKVEKRYLTYGLTPKADLAAQDITFVERKTEFTVREKGREWGRIRINLPGQHYVANALAAVAVGIELGINSETIREALVNYLGVERRFQVKGEVNQILVVDDYGHHPTEIAATLKAAQAVEPGRRIVVAFQPHRYSRTSLLASQFGEAFLAAEIVLVSEIYPAGEAPIPGVTAQLIVDSIRKYQAGPVELVSREKMVERLLELVRPGDLVITLGAGDIWKMGEEFLRRRRSS
jgi:UDP-N-acetylmuramate--alanine ligase